MDVSVGVPIHPAKEKPPINVVGDVGGRIAIMVVSRILFFFLCKDSMDWRMKFSKFQDDMIDDVASFVAAAEVLKDRGAYKIYVLATHGLLR